MKTIIVPTDYSANSKNAAEYALQLAAQLKADKVILYNAYQAPPILTEATVPVMPVMDIDTLKEISDQGMKHFMESIEVNRTEGTVIETKTSFGIVSDGLADICEETGADLIVMGISGASKLEEVLIGSTATSVMKHAALPVIVVSSEAKFSSLHNIMLASDFKNVVETTPIQPIKSLLNDTGASLHVVNVYENENDISGDKTYQQELVKSMLSDYNPEFHFINNPDFTEGINSFVDEHKIDLIITIQKKHGFFDGLFREGHAKKLAFHSHVPLMSVRFEE